RTFNFSALSVDEVNRYMEMNSSEYAVAVQHGTLSLAKTTALNTLAATLEYLSVKEWQPDPNTCVLLSLPSIHYLWLVTSGLTVCQQCGGPGPLIICPRCELVCVCTTCDGGRGPKYWSAHTKAVCEKTAKRKRAILSTLHLYSGGDSDCVACGRNVSAVITCSQCVSLK